MKSNWWVKFTFFIVITALAAYVAIPTLLNLSKDSSYPYKEKITLGLDLQGGLYMILGVDFKKVYRDEVKAQAFRIKDLIKDREEIDLEIGKLILEDNADPKISLTLPEGADKEKVQSLIKEFFVSQQSIRFTSFLDNGYVIGLNKQFLQDVQKNSIARSMEVIRNRIDEFGVAEPEIFSQGTDNIVVQLPGVKDIKRAKALIGRTAKLEFKMVDTEGKVNISELLEKAKKEGIEYKSGDRLTDYIERLNEFLKDDLPKERAIVFQKIEQKKDAPIEDLSQSLIPYIIEDNINLTGDDLQDARMGFDQYGRAIVNMTFKNKGADIFEQITTENVGRQFAIILDGNVYSAPGIREPIAGGRAQISMGQNNAQQAQDEAQDLALVLRAGALPVPLDFEEQRIVGPSLGADSILKARNAGLIGAILVFLFIIAYYKVSGVIAVVCLIANILYVLACLVGLEATLTLPGIAGIALTVGMAVDASIIIYERIKEEIGREVPAQKAASYGFNKAFWTILDANLTTALAGLTLLNFGTGPIRGFAVTLLIGIIATVYSAYYVGGMIFEYYTNRNLEKLSI